MPKYKVTLLQTAWRELDEIADIHMQLAGLKSAQKITNKILDKLEMLSEQPYMGSVPKYQFLEEQRFRVLICENYLCFYKIGADVVEIYHIADGRRDYPKLIF